MRIFTIFFKLSIVLFVLFEAGCRRPAPITEPIREPNKAPDIPVYTPYVPVNIDILPLTGFTGITDEQRGSKIIAYVSLLDSFGSQMKAPGVFRFELYEYLQRSGEPKGKRVAIWPDFKAINLAENHAYWQDFLRAYRFDLDFQPQKNKNFVLQVTFMCPSSKRLTAECVLKCTE